MPGRLGQRGAGHVEPVARSPADLRPLCCEGPGWVAPPSVRHDSAGTHRAADQPAGSAGAVSPSERQDGEEDSPSDTGTEVALRDGQRWRGAAGSVQGVSWLPAHRPQAGRRLLAVVSALHTPRDKGKCWSQRPHLRTPLTEGPFAVAGTDDGGSGLAAPRTPCPGPAESGQAAASSRGRGAGQGEGSVWTVHSL